MKKKNKKISSKIDKFECKSSLFDRFKAFVIDTFMVLMPIMYIVIYVVLGNREGFRENMALGWLIIISTHFISMIVLWSIKIQTPGLKAYDLQLVSKNHQKPSILQLIIRYFVTLFNMMLLVTLIIPFLNKDRLTLQDLLSQTCIIVKTDE